jgi:hypothetical protein
VAISDRARVLLSVASGVAVVGFVACAFPEHTFIEDDQFYGSDSGFGGSGGASGGVAGTGAGGTGAGGTGAGGTGAGGTGAGGTGGATGGTGGTTGGTGGSGNFGGALGENCTNGVDDDGDTQVDCLDAECQAGFTCVPSIPAGWTGPTALYAGAATAPDCLNSGGYTTVKQTAHGGLTPGSASCPTCSCDGTTGVSCEASIVLMTDATCGGGTCWGGKAGLLECGTAPFNNITVPNGLACSLLPTLISSTGAGAKGVWAGPLTSLGGACTSGQTGTKNIPTPTWSQSVRACGDGPSTGKGCGAGACMPRPATPFESGLCIYRTGDEVCPSPFAKKTLAHQNFSEGRDCSACACDPPSAACTGTLTLYTNDTCAANPTIVTPNTCTGIPVDPDPLTVFPPGTGGMPPADTRAGKLVASGTCPPKGGQVTGAATATGPITFCCL